MGIKSSVGGPIVLMNCGFHEARVKCRNTCSKPRNSVLESQRRSFSTHKSVSFPSCFEQLVIQEKLELLFSHTVGWVDFQFLSYPNKYCDKFAGEDVMCILFFREAHFHILLNMIRHNRHGVLTQRDTANQQNHKICLPHAANGVQDSFLQFLPLPMQVTDQNRPILCPAR